MKKLMLMVALCLLGASTAFAIVLTPGQPAQLADEMCDCYTPELELGKLHHNLILGIHCIPKVCLDQPPDL